MGRPDINLAKEICRTHVRLNAIVALHKMAEFATLGTPYRGHTQHCKRGFLARVMSKVHRSSYVLEIRLDADCSSSREPQTDAE